jgi:hypothetical protein
MELGMLRYLFTDLTKVGTSASAIPPFLDDEHIHKFNPKRGNFYLQFWSAQQANDRSPFTVFGIEERNREAKEAVEESTAKAASGMQYLTNHIDKGNRSDFAQKITNMMKGNIFLKAYKLEPKSGGGQQGGNGESLAKLQSKLDELKVIEKSNPDKYESDLKKLMVDYKNDPVLSPDNFKISSTDRVVAIAVTYVLRAVSLFLVEWGMNSYMIQGFESAFQTYLLIYIGMLTLVVTLANASRQLIIFRMIFYYFSIDPPNGIWRVLIHILVQLILLPVPFLVRDNNSVAPDQYSFESRRAVLRTLSQFTFFIWALTSAIMFMY